MRSHKTRLDRLANQLPAEYDDILIIRILYGGKEDPDKPPLVYKTDKNGSIIRRIGIDTIPKHLREKRIEIIE
jgi:hypothetical protein